MNLRRIYNNIINKALLENRVKHDNTYYEQHHIKPRCMGGVDTSSNIVLLTGKEHYLCHRLLSEMYPNNSKLFYAFRCMVLMAREYQDRYVTSSRVYEQVKIKASIMQSKRMNGRIPHNKGKIGTRNPGVSAALKGKSPWNAGKINVYSDETLKRMSVAAHNRNINPINERVRRDGISKNGRGNGYIRYKRLFDTRTNIEYESVTAFLITIKMNRVKYKKLLDKNIIYFI